MKFNNQEWILRWFPTKIAKRLIIGPINFIFGQIRVFTVKMRFYLTKISISQTLLIFSMIYKPFRGFYSAENRDRNCYSIDFKFGMSIVDQIYEVPYKFLRHWIIFGWAMLFLVSNCWIVKIKKKLKCSQWRHFLLILKENYREPPFYRNK